MKIQSVRLQDFKRFNDLTIDLTSSSKRIVALVGPNGSGKSSIFDAFEEFSSLTKGRSGKKTEYYKKSLFQGSSDSAYDPSNHITVVSDQENYSATSFYIRSAYRFTPRLGVERLETLPNIERDNKRPTYLIDMDVRLRDNYERLVGNFYDDVYDKEVTGKQWALDHINKINETLKSVLDIEITSLGNIVKGAGTLFFNKGSAKMFPYENLSAGEKEVIDIVIDLHVKGSFYTNSVICIDEPELHLNTAIQRKLLIEIEKLIPPDSQLWVATHSVGFLRALQEELRDKSTIIDFTGCNFDATVVLKPIPGSRKDWTRIFQTALEDLTGLMAPRQIIYCEGRPEPTAAGEEQGLDANAYNEIFSEAYPDTLFVSSGGGGVVKINALLALKVLGKAFNEVRLLLLKDRDTLNDDKRKELLTQDPSLRMLERREIENYLFDKEVLIEYCKNNSKEFDEKRFDSVVADIKLQDLKLIQQDIMRCCSFSGTIPEFKLKLAKYLKNGMEIYKALESLIF